MKILAVGRMLPGQDTSAIAQHAGAEMKAVWDLYRADVVRELYSPGGPGSVLVLEAESTAAAVDVLAGLPLVAAGVIGFEVIELHPFAALSLAFSGG